MSPPTSRKDQIIATHAAFIVDVVRTCQDGSQRERGAQMIGLLRQSGQDPLAGAIERILEGARDERLAASLDEDDRVIVEAILEGLQDPATLPDAHAGPDPSAAAPGLANMIHAAGTGNNEALQILGHMAEQMTAAGGDMARVAGIIRALVEGERRSEALCAGMSRRGETLVLSILEELGRLEAH